MTTKFEEKIYKLGQSVGLTFDEREGMRSRLLSQISRSERKVLSPYSPMFYWQHISPYVKPQYVSLALLVVLFAGGVSVVAEKALPGEPLYQVKTSVNENVLGLFAFTPQSKAQLHTELAVRRLEEVEKLAISGKLDATTTAVAESKIDGNLAVIKDSVKQLETNNNSIAAVDTSSKVESTLKVHEAILDTLVDGNTVVNSAVQNIAEKVGVQATALSLDRAGIDSRTSSTTVSIDVLLDQQKVAQNAIALAKSAIASSTEVTATGSVMSLMAVSAVSISSSTASSTVEAKSAAVIEAETKLKGANDLLIQAEKKLESKDYGEAFVLFTDAEKMATSAKISLEVKENLPFPSETQNSTSTPAAEIK